MKPLVTVLGGTGFVGTELISRLARAGYRLRVLTRDSRGSRTLAVLPTVEQRATAVHDAEALTRAIAAVAPEILNRHEDNNYWLKWE